MEKNLKCAVYSKPSIKCTIRLESEVVSTQWLGEKKENQSSPDCSAMWHQTISLAEFLTGLSKQIRCCSPIVAVLKSQPLATREIEALPGHHVLGSSARLPADSAGEVTESVGWMASIKLIRFHRTLFETLKDNLPELAHTSREAPALPGPFICVGIVPDSSKVRDFLKYLSSKSLSFVLWFFYPCW